MKCWGFGRGMVAERYVERRPWRAREFSRGAFGPLESEKGRDRSNLSDQSNRKESYISPLKDFKSPSIWPPHLSSGVALLSRQHQIARAPDRLPTARCETKAHVWPVPDLKVAELRSTNDVLAQTAALPVSSSAQVDLS
jgi:hypothetical protein